MFYSACRTSLPVEFLSLRAKISHSGAVYMRPHVSSEVISCIFSILASEDLMFMKFEVRDHSGDLVAEWTCKLEAL